MIKLLGITVTKHLGNTWHARLFDIQAQGHTKEATLASLAQIIINLAKFKMDRTYRMAADGTLFVLFHNGDGWQYDIIGREHIEQGRPATVICGSSYEEALRLMENHARDYYG